MINFLIAYILPIVTGYLILNLFNFKNDFESFIYKLILGSSLGIGLSSIFYFVNLIIHPINTSLLMGFELGFLISLLVVNYKHNKLIAPRLNSNFKSPLGYTFLIANFVMVLLFIIFTLKNPYGNWDGWRMWNTKALFLAIGGDNWQNIFHLASPLIHNDYPLLIPSSVARISAYLGSISFLIPASIAMFFTFSSVWLVYSSLSILKNQKTGLIAGTLLLGTQPFIAYGASQCADIPLAFYILAVFSLFLIMEKLKISKLYILMGVFAGLACWTKNEGLIFAGVISFIVFLSTFCKHKVKEFKYFIWGLAPLLAFIVYFKTTFSSHNDILQPLTFEMLKNNILDISRYITIAHYFMVKTLYLIGIIVSLSLYLLWGRDKENWFIVKYLFLAVLIVLLAYAFIYLITPHTLLWQLDNSCIRLLIHLVPAAILIILFNTDVVTEK